MHSHDKEALTRLAEYTLADMARNADNRGLCRECALVYLLDMCAAILADAGEAETMH